MQLTRLSINALAGVLALAIGTCVSFWITPYLVRSLGMTQFGVYSYIVALVGYFAFIPGTLAIVVNREIGQADSLEAKSDIVSATLKLVLLISILIVATLYLLEKSVLLDRVPSDVSSSHAQIGLWLLVFVLLIRLVWIPAVSLLVARDRLDILRLGEIVDALLKVLLIAASFVLFGPSILNLFVALFVAGMGQVLTIVAASYVQRTGALPLFSRIDSGYVGKILNDSSWVLVAQLGGVLLVSSNVLVAGYFIGPEAAGTMAALLVLVAMLRVYAQVLGSIFSPLIYRLQAAGEFDELVAFTKRSISLLALFIVLPVAGVCGFGGVFLELWMGDEFGQYYYLLFLMVFPLGLNLIVLPIFTFNLAHNSVRLPGVVGLILGVFALSMSSILAMKLGLLGIVLSGTIVLTLKNTIFTPLYAAHVASEKWSTFFEPLFWPMLALFFLSGTFIALVSLLQITSWVKFVSVVFLVSLLYAVIVYFLVMTTEQKAMLHSGVSV